MFILRPVTKHDLNAIETIAASATLGITSLPKNRDKLKERLGKAVASFKKPHVDAPHDEVYLFLLEDTETKEVAGMTGIQAQIGLPDPHYFFRIVTHREAEDRQTELKVLKLVKYEKGPTEIGSLFVLKKYRSEGFGKLLSLSRFLFMASHPTRFAKKTIAEMRGVIEEGGTSPLWRACGQHFFNSSFREALELRDQGLFDLKSILPKYPIYISLLEEEAQEVIGKTHPNTLPALAMLKKQGFHETDEIDLFDGGPKLEAKTADIDAVKHSVATIISTIDDKAATRAIVATTELACHAAYALIDERNDGIAINKEAADALHLTTGSPVRYYKTGGS